MRPSLSLFICVTVFFASTATAAFAASGPVTNLHTIPVPPAEISQTVALGFNLVMIEKVDDANGVAIVNGLPAGTKALVQWPGWCVGATSEFTSWAQRYAGNEKLYGFYLFDEPTPSTCAAANVKAETDWVHANMPGVKTFLVLNEQNAQNQSNYEAYGNAVDYLGLDPYPCWPGMACWFGEITKVVNQALTAGVSREKIVPVYQAFEGDGMFRMPTADEERQILATWANVIPNPPFDYVFSWRAYGTTGWKTLRDQPEQREVFKEYFASIAAPTCTLRFPSASTPSAGFGASWNQFTSAKELLLSATCSGTNLYVTAGNSDATTYVYKTGYRWVSGAWQAYTLSGATPSGDWFKTTASATIPKLSGTTYFVGYTCQRISGAWKCGCSDATCATGKWQLQGVE